MSYEKDELPFIVDKFKNYTSEFIVIVDKHMHAYKFDKSTFLTNELARFVVIKFTVHHDSAYSF
jgi:hypothetical protein